VRVIATQKGFYEGELISPGTTFELDESILKVDPVDGQPILPRWCLRADQQDLAAKRIEFDKTKMVGGAIASSGQGASGGAATRKMKEISDQNHFEPSAAKGKTK